MLRNKHQYFHNYPTKGLKFKITVLNDSLLTASLINGNEYYGHKQSEQDPNGALIYVIAVVFLWGMSIVMLIASYVRKTRIDKNISLYLKEIQSVRNRSDRQKIMQVVHTLDRQSNSPPTRLGSITTCGSSCPASPNISPTQLNERRWFINNPASSCQSLLSTGVAPLSTRFIPVSSDQRKRGSSSSKSVAKTTSGNHHHRMVPQICIQEEEDLTDCNLSGNEVSSTSEYEPESPEAFFSDKGGTLCTKV